MKILIIAVAFLIGCGRQGDSVYVDVESPDTYLVLKQDGGFLFVTAGGSFHGTHEFEGKELLLKSPQGEAKKMMVYGDSLFSFEYSLFMKCDLVNSSSEYQELFYRQIAQRLGTKRSANVIVEDLTKIARDAYRYRIMPRGMGGGGGVSYIGYEIKSFLSRNENGKYSITVTRDSVLIKGEPSLLRGEIDCVVDNTGRTKHWRKTWDLAEADRTSWW